MNFDKIYDEFHMEVMREQPNANIRKKNMVKLMCENGPKCTDEELKQVYEECKNLGDLVTVLEQLQGHCSRKDVNIFEKQKLINGFINANPFYSEKYNINASDFM